MFEVFAENLGYDPRFKSDMLQFIFSLPPLAVKLEHGRHEMSRRNHLFVWTALSLYLYGSCPNIGERLPPNESRLFRLDFKTSLKLRVAIHLYPKPVVRKT